MNGVTGPSIIAQLRARDGDNCWLCLGKLDFAAAPNSRKAPTKEHLEAKSRGGKDTFDNLVLCHPGCNKQLGNRPKADKFKIRGKYIAKRDKQAPAVNSRTLSRRSTAGSSRSTELRNVWRTAAVLATVVAAFFAGLSAGLILAG